MSGDEQRREEVLERIASALERLAAVHEADATRKAVPGLHRAVELGKRGPRAQLQMVP